MIFRVSLPLKVQLGRKGFSLNLNQYRNAHYQVLNNAKKAFEIQIAPVLVGIPKLSCISIKYTVYPSTKRLFDIANVCSVADKFFCDTLTNQGIIPDDNYTVIKEVSYCFGSVDPKQPRIEAEINGY